MVAHGKKTMGLPPCVYLHSAFWYGKNHNRSQKNHNLWQNALKKPYLVTLASRLNDLFKAVCALRIELYQMCFLTPPIA